MGMHTSLAFFSNPPNDTGLVSQYIRSIFQGSKRSFWFGLAGQSLVRYDLSFSELCSEDFREAKAPKASLSLTFRTLLFSKPSPQNSKSTLFKVVERD